MAIVFLIHHYLCHLRHLCVTKGNTRLEINLSCKAWFPAWRWLNHTDNTTDCPVLVSTTSLGTKRKERSFQENFTASSKTPSKIASNFCVWSYRWESKHRDTWGTANPCAFFPMEILHSIFGRIVPYPFSDSKCLALLHKVRQPVKSWYYQ